VFSPAAAFLAGGLGPASLGPAVDLDTLEQLDVPVPQVSASEIVARVLIVDRFGNVQLNLTASDLEQVGIVPGTRIELEIGLERYFAVAARTFADVPRGEIVLYEDSYRNISIAINVGDAALVMSARLGDRVRIRARA
jgi:S-adenosylmethionine hydrolase